VYAACRLRANELNYEVAKTLTNIFRQTEKSEQGIQDIEAGRGIIKTMAEPETMENA